MPENAPHKPHFGLFFAPVFAALVATSARAYRRQRQRRQLSRLVRRLERETFAEGEALRWRLRLKRK